MKLFLIILISLICVVKCENILIIVTTPYKSHVSSLFNLVEELAKAHTLTFAVPKGLEMINPSENISLILPDTFEEFKKNFLDARFDRQEAIKQVFTLKASSYQTTENFLKSEEIQDLLSSNQTFDLVITETSLNDAILGFSEHFNCPHITISYFHENPIPSKMTQNPSQTSYVPHMLLDFTPRMTFFQRFCNVIYSWRNEIFIFWYIREQEKLYKKYFPNSESFLPLREKINYGVSVVFVFSHFSISNLQPRQPNSIEIAGLHLKDETDPLPSEIQNFMDTSEHGIIYFSFGSTLKPELMTENQQKSILSALSKRKEKIILKWSDFHLNGEIDDDKFLISDWFPSQASILSHPKVRCFITHGGMLGHQEAIYYGIPIVAIPILFDHIKIAIQSVDFGYGEKLLLSNLNESSFTWALNEVLDNPKYAMKAKELSIRFRDKPQKPVDSAKFYIEYVMRHNGAEFMRFNFKDLTFIHFYNIGVYFSMFVGFILTPIVIFKLIKNTGKHQNQDLQKKLT